MTWWNVKTWFAKSKLSAPESPAPEPPAFSNGEVAALIQYKNDAEHSDSTTLADVFSFKKTALNVAMQDEEYVETLDFSKAVKEGVEITCVASEKLAELGLAVSCENGIVTISGVPKERYDGDLIVRVDYRFENLTLSFNPSDPDDECLGSFDGSKDFKIPFTIVGWKEIEPDPELPYRKEHGVCDCGALPNSKVDVIGASQRGRSHANVGSFREDDFKLAPATSKDEWSVFAVADGAGSAKLSREGSRIVCEQFVQGLGAILNDPQTRAAFDKKIVDIYRANPDAIEADEAARGDAQIDKIFHRVVYNAHMALMNACKEHNEKYQAQETIRAFHTTALCLAIKKLPKVDDLPDVWCVASYWIGDGGLSIYRPNGAAQVLTLGVPDGGEHAGETRFITMQEEIDYAHIAKRVRLAFVRDFQAIALMSDGISDPFFPAENNIFDYGYWQTFWNDILPKEFPGALDAKKKNEERAEALLKGLMFKNKGNHDDRTLVLLVNEAFEPAPEPPAAPETPAPAESTAPAANAVEAAAPESEPQGTSEETTSEDSTSPESPVEESAAPENATQPPDASAPESSEAPEQKDAP